MFRKQAPFSATNAYCPFLIAISLNGAGSEVKSKGGAEHECRQIRQVI